MNEVGAPLKEGEAYTLLIDRDWRDAQGKSLKEGFKKVLRRWLRPIGKHSRSLELAASPPHRPGALGLFPLSFSEPLDHGLLMRLLEVMDSPGRNSWKDRSRSIAMKPAGSSLPMSDGEAGVLFPFKVE